MKTLVFDTCFNKSYIVLRENGNIISSDIIESTDKNYHSAYLIPKIRDILKENNLLIKDLDAIGVNIGPGSFTGIRAGITIARVLCQQADIKLVGISSLEILSKLNNSDMKTIVTLDARKNKVYYAEYLNNKAIIEPSLIEKDELLNNIDSHYIVIADKSITDYLTEQGIEALNFEKNDSKIGLFLSDIVYMRLESAQEDYNWAKVKPLYIQQPSITVKTA